MSKQKPRFVYTLINIIAAIGIGVALSVAWFEPIIR